MAELRAATDLDTVVDFLNTLHVDTDADALTEVEGLASWLDEVGLVDGPIRAGEADLALARELRTVLRTLARANHDGASAPDAVRRLDELAATLGVQVRFRADGDVELAGGGAGATAALGAIVAATAAAVADDRWPRLKLCGADDCAWAFYDGSRNRSGRWCSMAACGNREKARNFRRRHAHEDATG